MYEEICIGLCIGWIVIYEVLKRTVFPKIFQDKEERNLEYEVELALGLVPTCEICGQEEHTTEEHYTRNRAGSFDADGDGISDQYDDF